MITRRKLVFGIGALTVVYPAVSAAMALGLTRTRRMRPDDSPASVGVPYDDVSFMSADGRVRLSGWLMPPPVDGQGARWVVIVHGYGTNKGDPQAGALGFARDLHNEGFGVLSFDLRGCGDSGGSGSVGFHEREDLLGALGFLGQRGVDRASIGVHGFSLGGVVALTACSQDGVAGAVVADSSFTDLWSMICANSTGIMRPTALFHSGMDVLARAMFGIEIGDISPVAAVASSNTPILIVHGDRDEMVPVEHARRIYDAATSVEDGSASGQRQAELWIAPGAGHVQAYREHREEYVRRVTGFFRSTLA